MAALDFTFERREKLIRRDSLEEGIQQGIQKGLQQGVQQGISQGEITKLVTLICRKLKKGKTAAVIAEELEEDPALVESICKTAESFAPDYDTEKIYAALREKTA